jgi:hypothetical protein
VTEKISEDKSKNEATVSGGASGNSADNDPEVRAAAASVEQAREQLRAAEACYRELREKAEEKFGQLRSKTVGDIIDSILLTTKKHPLPCILAAGALGFFLGRLLRR